MAGESRDPDETQEGRVDEEGGAIGRQGPVTWLRRHLPSFEKVMRDGITIDRDNEVDYETAHRLFRNS